MMKRYKLLEPITKCFFSGVIVLILLSLSPAYAETPITTDSRIKTYVYNENEVYPIVVHYGYQSHIEFGLGEQIQTLVAGDTYSWKFMPLDRRLFIQTFEANAHTNLTIITNRHTYQFDLLSKMPDEHIDEELVYVVRFFYPSDPHHLDRVGQPLANAFPNNQPSMNPAPTAQFMPPANSNPMMLPSPTGH